MTSRSQKQQPKTTTISRRIRNRADQSLSVQPSELRALRSHRPATLPLSTSHPSADHQTQEEALSFWGSSDILDPFPRSNTSRPAATFNDPASNLLLSEVVNIPPYHSPRQSPADLRTRSAQPECDQFEIQPSSRSNLLPSPLPSISSARPAVDFELRLSIDPKHPQDHSVELQDMSTLGFMVPAQYGSLDHHYESPSIDSSGYANMNQHPYSDSRNPRPTTSGAYPPSYTSSSQPRRSMEHTVLPPYQSSVPRSPYQQPLASMRASPTNMSYPPTASETSPMLNSPPHTYSYPAAHAGVPGQGLSPLNTTGSYPPPALYPPSSYEMSGYSSHPPTMYPPSNAGTPYSPYEQPGGLAPPSAGAGAGIPSSPGSNGVMPRVLNSRPKPQCWEHGCNGRQFSTFSNLLRHQREKSGTAAKSYCPRCGAEFTRTTARNGHLAHEKCKPRRTSDSSR